AVLLELDADVLLSARLFSTRTAAALASLPARAVDREIQRFLASSAGKGPQGDGIARQIRLAYRKALHRVDGLFGALLDRMAALALPKDTLVIVLSDHGEALGERPD